MLYNIEKLLADSQANAILTKGSSTIVLTVTECPEVAAGELGSWVTAVYADTKTLTTLAVSKFDNMYRANDVFTTTISYNRDRGYIFANEEYTDHFLGSNLAAKDDDYEHVRDYPFYD